MLCFLTYAVVAARELQKHILSGSIRGVAGVLLHSESVAGIAAGMRVPRGYDFKENATNRDADPDVVLIKGLALCMVSVDRQEERNAKADKLTQAIIIAVNPPVGG